MREVENNNYTTTISQYKNALNKPEVTIPKPRKPIIKGTHPHTNDDPTIRSKYPSSTWGNTPRGNGETKRIVMPSAKKTTELIPSSKNKPEVVKGNMSKPPTNAKILKRNSREENLVVHESMNINVSKKLSNLMLSISLKYLVKIPIIGPQVKEFLGLET